MRSDVPKTESINNSKNMSNSNKLEELSPSTHPELDKVLVSLPPALFSGTVFTLSEARGKVNKIMLPNQINNSQVKSFLIKKLSEGISFSPSTRRSESLMFYQPIYQPMILLKKFDRQMSSKNLHIYYISKSSLVLLVSKKTL